MLDISFQDAVDISQGSLIQVSHEWVPASQAVGRIAVTEVRALVDSPSADVSVKDGYAVKSDDVASAAPGKPVFLHVVSRIAAGQNRQLEVNPGQAVRVLSGAVLPSGADAVLAEEFTCDHGDVVEAQADSHKGRNILVKGADVSAGEVLAQPGQEMTASIVGLMVAAGVTQVEVYRRPRIGLLGIGDELVLPGIEQRHGEIYASNLALQEAWLLSYGFPCETRVCRDSSQEIALNVTSLAETADVVLTSGGAWKSERDLVVKVLESLGWQILFQRVRLGPGKAVAMAVRGNSIVFCLPGGPPSNEAAFLMIALPAVLRVAGSRGLPYPKLMGSLEEEVTGQEDWTQVIHCKVARDGAHFRLHPLDMKRRLISMARAQGLCIIPEGCSRISAGSMIPFFCLDKGVMEKDW